MARFVDTYDLYRARSLTGEEAGELLGMSGRNFRRLCVRYEGHGIDRPSPRRAPTEELARMQDLYIERYSDFTVRHFHEHLVGHHHYKLGYTVMDGADVDGGVLHEAFVFLKYFEDMPDPRQRGKVVYWCARQ